MNSLMFFLGWLIEELTDALLRGIWIRYHKARHSGDQLRASSILARFDQMVGAHDFGCRIQYWNEGQLIVTGPHRPVEIDDEF